MQQRSQSQGGAATQQTLQLEGCLDQVRCAHACARAVMDVSALCA